MVSWTAKSVWFLLRLGVGAAELEKPTKSDF